MILRIVGMGVSWTWQFQDSLPCHFLVYCAVGRRGIDALLSSFIPCHLWQEEELAPGSWTWENWPCSLPDAKLGRACLAPGLCSRAELTFLMQLPVSWHQGMRVGAMNEDGEQTNFHISHTQKPGLWVVRPNIYLIYKYELLGLLKGRVLQTQKYSIAIIDGKSRTSKRCPIEVPVLIEEQNPEAL